MIVTAARLKLINKSRVLWEIHRRPGISRRELSLQLNSTDTSLSRITRELIDEGLILEKSTTQPSGRGRPNVGLLLNPSGLHILCIVLSRYERRMSIVGLAGQRVSEKDLDEIEKLDPPHIVRCASDLINVLVGRPELGFARLAGVSLIISADADLRNIHEVDLLKEAVSAALHEEFSVPVIRSGIAQAIHLAEVRHASELPSVMIHAGFALNVSVIGYVGHSLTTVYDGNLNNIPIGYDGRQHGWTLLEDIASAGAILRRLGHVVTLGPSAHTGLSLGVPHTIRQANSGDARAATVFQDAGSSIAMAVAALVTILTPARVILAGPLASALPFFDGFRTSFERTMTGNAVTTALTRSSISDLQAAELAGLKAFAFDLPPS